MDNHLDPRIKEAIAGSVREVSAEQMTVLSRMTFAQRFQIGCSISNLARTTVANRLRQRYPELSQVEAERQAVQSSYHNE
jgi:hypothetical protein